MLKLFEQVCDFYDYDTNLNTDLIKAGILVHDVGKIEEFCLENAVPTRNPENALLTHHALGDALLLEIIQEIEGFPKDLENKVRHIIISHHGKKEWGSPIEPRFIEAEIIQYLEIGRLDALFKDAECLRARAHQPHHPLAL